MEEHGNGHGTVVGVSNLTMKGALLLVLIGLAMAGGGGYKWLEQGERIDSYESTEATVLSSEIAEHLSSSGEGTSRTYSPEITYEYTVDGRTYEGSNVLPGSGETRKGENWARGIVENHPEGETVTAYYDPQNPSNAFLVENRERMYLFVAGVGGLLALGSLGALGRKLLGSIT